MGLIQENYEPRMKPMTVRGRFLEVKNFQTGESKRGAWQKCEIWVKVGQRNDENYCFQVFGDKGCEAVKTLQKGQAVECVFYINCGEFTSKTTGQLNSITQLSLVDISLLAEGSLTEF